MSDPRDAVARIARLEVVVRRLRLTVVLGVVAALGLVAMGQAASPTRLVSAERFHVLAADGKVRASLGVRPDGSVALLMFGGEAGETRGAIDATVTADGVPSIFGMRGDKAVFLLPAATTSGSPGKEAGSAPVKSRGWRTLKEWSGKGPKQTESFEIGVKEWRVRWAVTGEAGKGFGTFGIWVKDEEDSMVSLAANHQGIGSDVSYVRAPAGRFYLDVSSANAEWTCSVEVPE